MIDTKPFYDLSKNEIYKKGAKKKKSDDNFINLKLCHQKHKPYKHNEDYRSKNQSNMVRVFKLHSIATYCRI